MGLIRDRLQLLFPRQEWSIDYRMDGDDASILVSADSPTKADRNADEKSDALVEAAFAETVDDWVL